MKIAGVPGYHLLQYLFTEELSETGFIKLFSLPKKVNRQKLLQLAAEYYFNSNTTTENGGSFTVSIFDFSTAPLNAEGFILSGSVNEL